MYFGILNLPKTNPFAVIHPKEITNAMYFGILNLPKTNLFAGISSEGDHKRHNTYTLVLNTC
jgi:hypothetical protein